MKKTCKNKGIIDGTKLGSKIRELLDQKGISVPEMAEAVHVTKQVAYRYCKGTTRPSVQTLVAIARLLGVSVDSLLQASVREGVVL